MPFDIADWSPASDYTDDTTADAAMAKAEANASGIEAEGAAREAAIKDVQASIADMKANNEATYATKTDVDERTGAITRTLSADYTRTADLANTSAVQDAKAAGTSAQASLNAYETTNDAAVAAAKKAGTDASAALDAYKTTVAETYVEQAAFTAKVDELSSTMSGNYSAFEQYQTTNDAAVADAKSAGTTAQSQLSSYKSSNDKAVADAKKAGTDASAALSDYQTSNDAAVAAAKKAGTDASAALDSYKKSNDAAISSIQTNYVTKSAFDQSNTSIQASVSDTLTQAKSYTDGQVKTEAANRDAAIKAQADSITSTVSKTYATKSESSSAASAAQSAAISAAAKDATTKADNAKSAAIADTDSKLKNYSTTAQMNSAIRQQADSITSTVSKTYVTSSTFSSYKTSNDSAVSTATSTANAAKSTAASAATDAASAKHDAQLTFVMAITSDKGTALKTESDSTTLTAHVYRAGAELSASDVARVGVINWYKDGGTTAVGTGATLAVSAASVSGKAVYTARLEG